MNKKDWIMSDFLKLIINKMQNKLDVTLPLQENSQAIQNHQSILDKLDAPSSNFNLSPNSLEYDIKLGWLPRSQITGPIPLSFSHQLYDEVINSKSKSILFLGWRPRHSFQLHQECYQKGKKYSFHLFHLCKSQFLDRFFKKHYSDYDFTSSRKQQTLLPQSPLNFSSAFEGGNLDAVYYQQDQYRLLLRVDSNTQGHCNYFYFRVRVNIPGKYGLKIVNINKMKSLYQRGMKPYVRGKKDGKWGQFKQADIKVKFSDSPLCDEFQMKGKLKSVYFQYDFLNEGEELQFCYTIPFTYSDLISSMNLLRNNSFVHLSKLCHTLSGVEIPLLTIADPNKQQQNYDKKQPYVVVLTARVHPSEANSSHIINGAIKAISGNLDFAKSLRKSTIFKVIPMLNPDGVIMGNTRTSFSGRDLNRRYEKNSQFVYPQILGVMDYVAKLKSKYGSKLLFLVDIHGHSSRKNSFFYGPQYSITDLQYGRCRLLPRLYAQTTQIFRYYSCKYRLATSKQRTARGYFNSIGVRAYTHETSMHSYWNFQYRKDQAFTKTSLEKLGQSLVKSIAAYVDIQISLIRQGRQEIPEKDLPDIPVRTKEVDVQESDNSEEMDSNKDDSEDETQDFADKKLQQFYNRINQNKEYFIQELEALHKDSNDKQKQKQKLKSEDRKLRKNQSMAKVETQQSQSKLSNRKQKQKQKLQEQLVVKKNLDKVNWASKVIYPEKKRTLQQYTKMSSVIFGSSIPPSYFEHKYPQQPMPTALSSFNSTKYSIKYLEAQFKVDPVSHPSPQPRIYHSKSLKKQISMRQREVDREKQKEKIKDKTEEEKVQRMRRKIFMQLKQQSEIQAAIITRQKAMMSRSEMERLLSKPCEYVSVKQLPICSVDLQVQRQNQAKMIKQIDNSLKVLTRKKSIKSFKDSNQAHQRRHSQSKTLKGSLTKKLPSLHTLINKF